MSCGKCSKKLYGRLVDTDGDFSHITRRKKWYEFILIGLAICGIDYCYATESALVTPILLELGVPVKYMTMFWCIGPTIDFFVVPILGSCSDRCTSRLGRRKPFILLNYCGIFLGLIILPNATSIGVLLGDLYMNSTSDTARAPGNITTSFNQAALGVTEPYRYHTWSIVFTIVGMVLLDVNCDSCQAPARSFVLDLTVPEDHSKALTTVTLMGGVGSAIGYIMVGINWGETTLILHAQIVFGIVLAVCVVCAIVTMFSMKEMPLEMQTSRHPTTAKHQQDQISTTSLEHAPSSKTYGTLDDVTNGDSSEIENFQSSYQSMSDESLRDIGLTTYLKSILQMPKGLAILCLTNFWSCMSIVSYFLYFTDFVGQTIYGGDPNAPTGSFKRSVYEQGVMVGSLCMSLMAFGTSVYAFAMDKLMLRFGTKPVYIIGQLAFCLGCTLMAVIHHPAILMFSFTGGIMYATVCNMPYLLVARYHVNGTFQDFKEGVKPLESNMGVRGLGTDLAIVTSVYFLAQIVLSMCMGSLIHAIGSTVVVVAGAAILALAAALTATQVVYQDM